jgi:DNA-binding MarR family transcriptional regulator/GNAT superfamily N-acetyltransferase
MAFPSSAAAPTSALQARAAAMRRFNRFYTREIGVLQEGYSGGPFSLAEARVLYEIICRKQATASDIASDLDLDQGYLSRILRTFEAKGYIRRVASPSDARQSLLSSTPRGRKAFAPVERQTQERICAKLGALPSSEQDRLIEALKTVEQILSPSGNTVPYILRPLQPGDIGWVVSRHGTIYGQEFGWDNTIEALTAEIAAAFVRNFDPARERCWIAERNGQNVGCVFLVREDDATARLRLLLVDPSARGLGIGTRLVEECIRFAKVTGYRRLTLWTHRVLTAARNVYMGRRFTLSREWTHDDFGKTLVAETWDLDL